MLRATQETAVRFPDLPACQEDGCGRHFLDLNGLHHHMANSHDIYQGAPKVCPCPFCPEKFPTKRGRLRHLVLVHPEEERGRRLRAYMDYDTDREAADALGMTRNAFGAWRRKQGLPPKRDLTSLSRTD